ncbi:WD40-repeat-containing domain protein [Cladochytrium replicatum]|nr:WD40-repeat-containing domain protein [Cladochytrium replicatum]
MLSSGIDGVIQLHNVFGMLVADEFGTDVSAHTLRVFRIDAAVKDVRWSIGGDRFYSAGMDSRLRVFDIVRGVELHEFINSDPVSSICCHPTDPNLVLAGMSRNGISCWDTRSNKVCRQFKSQFGQVHDMMFTPPETIRFKPAVQLPSSLNTTFISTSDVLSRSTSGHGILEWDFHSGLVVSSQLYSEGFSCTALRLHPYGQQFVAQSHENCILTFSLAGKRKLVNHKTFRGHFTAANNISLSFSPDGQFLSTGSSTGEIHHFEYSSGRPVKVVQNAHARTACVCVEWAKCTGILGNQQGSVMVSAGWDGTVSVWK